MRTHPHRPPRRRRAGTSAARTLGCVLFMTLLLGSCTLPGRHAAPPRPVAAPVATPAPATAPARVHGAPPRTPAAPLRRALSATITPGDAATVGVGQPVIVDFNTAVADHAVAERGLHVLADRPLGDAGWYWFGDREVQFRPKTYWPSGTKVTVIAALTGLRTGATTWGARDTRVSFTIGRSQVLRIDAVRHRMTVIRDGKPIRTVPVSLGQHQGTLRTRSGIKTIMAVERTVHMDSRTVGIDGSDAYNEDVPYAMRLTWSGEYVHGAPWSEWAQGRQDVSHGCTNVSLANGKWLFENSLVGDPVETIGTGRPMEPGNGWGGGWNIPWPAWKAGSALA
jgi:lipoprotein-anchoring transpeptidase ErfK/SrfK